MSTLQQLIANGLQVGQLVKTPNEILQYMGVNYLGQKYFSSIDGNKNFAPMDLDSIKAEITTAHDSRIDPDVLPVPEPFATGWAIYTYFNPQKIMRIQGNIIWLYDFHLQEVIDYEIEYCTPCLPPNNEKI